MKKPLNGELKTGRPVLLETRTSARNSWLLTPFILTPIELIRLSRNRTLGGTYWWLALACVGRESLRPTGACAKRRPTANGSTGNDR